MRAGGLSLSVLLLAAGAILTWAVNIESNNVDVATVGVILMAAGGAGLTATLAFAAAGSRTVAERDREVVVDRDRTRHPEP